MRGVLAKGYGLLPKIIMTAPVLRLEAKALYAYFVSYTGSGCNRAFPSRDKILSDISLTPNTYYKYLNELIELGLISVEQKNGGSAGKGFKRNIYTVEGYSEKFIFALALHRNSTDESLILVEGVKDITAAGYGIIPKSVMTDPDLSLKAKGVYAYFCAFSGTSYVSAPYKELILYHLDIASNSYPKYIHELVKNGYIRKTRRVVNGRFSGMTYTINRDSEAGLPHTRNSDTVDMIPDKPYTKNSDTMKSSADEPHTVFSDTMDSDTDPPYTNISDTVKSHTIFSDAINSDTINNSSLPVTELTSNSLNQSIARETSENDGAIEAAEKDNVLEMIANSGGIPYTLCTERSLLESAVEIITGLSSPEKNAGQSELQRYRLFVTALTEMLSAGRTPTVIRGARIGYAKVCDALNACICTGFNDFGEPYAEALQLYELIAERYRRSAALTEITNPLGYMKAIIWTELTTGLLELEDKFSHDMKYGG